jgi:hypothetical protein
MADTTLVDLETAIKRLPGVLGCVILTDQDGAPSEIQAFTVVGSDQQGVQDSIETEVAERGLAGALHQVFVFELEADSHFGDRETLARAAELAEQEARTRGPRVVDPGQELRSLQTVRGRASTASTHRPPLLRVAFSSTHTISEASVALGSQQTEVVGEASGEKTPHGLRVLAEATLGAVAQLLGESQIQLLGASIVEVVGSEGVLVLVREVDGQEMLGAALLRGGPVAEAAVRATLDAVNRRLDRGPAQAE